MLFKVIGAVLLLSCAVTVAFLKNRRIDRSISQLEALSSLMGFFRAQIDCFCTPVGEIFRRADEKLIESCKFSVRPQSADDFTKLDGDIPKDVSVLLTSFAAELGTLYREEQLKSCDYYHAKLRESLTKFKAEAITQKKLNTVLCVSAAIGIIILFI